MVMEGPTPTQGSRLKNAQSQEVLYQKEAKEHRNARDTQKDFKGAGAGALRRYAHFARLWVARCCGDSVWARRALLLALVCALMVAVSSPMLLMRSVQDPLGRRLRAGNSSSRRCPKRPQEAAGAPDLESRFTVIINTFKRPDLLKTSIAHYEACAGVDQIRVVWSEQESEPYQRDVAGHKPFFSDCVEVTYDRHPTTSINNRFLPVPGIRTRAVFNVDDDVNVHCADLATAHKLWQQTPDTLVGFIPRLHLPDPAAAGAYLYRRWWTVWLTNKYSIVLTKACFMHNKYLEMYSHAAPSAMLAQIEAQRNCEDIAMQFVVANATGQPPVWVWGRYSDSGAFDGISTTGTGIASHRKMRDNCLTNFAEFYGGMPLVESSHYVVPSGSWVTFFNPPSWMEWFAFP